MANRQLSRLLWGVFAVAIVVLGYQFNDRLDMIFATRGELKVEESPGQVTLRWRGAIEAPMAARIEEAFRTHSAGQPRFVLSLASPGGQLDHGREVIRVMKRMQQTHAVDTRVEGRNVCASMCVAVYVAGRQRTADPRARFMFHEVSYRDSLNEKISDVPGEAIARATDQMFDRYFKTAGLDGVWLDDIRGKIRGRDVWLTAEQLVQERSGVVQRLE
jgi:ATP-dependent protease ClpP protease subunit